MQKIAFVKDLGSVDTLSKRMQALKAARQNAKQAHDSAQSKVSECFAAMEKCSGLALMQKQTFENFSCEYYRSTPDAYRVMEDNYRYLRRYAESFALETGKQIPESLLFLGGTGLGKTHLSTAIARVVTERGYDVFYNSAVGMISDFESRRFGNGVAAATTDDTSAYTECDLLIIDDLGTEVTNQFTIACLYDVINQRINQRKSTIINTNLSFRDLETRYSERITSRLLGEYRMLMFAGSDIRRQKVTKGK